MAAIVGGYALSALATMFLSAALPMAVVSAVLAATLLSFLMYAAAVVWVFAAATAGRAWLGLLICAVALVFGLLAFKTS